jgi:hypothetical protein
MKILGVNLFLAACLVAFSSGCGKANEREAPVEKSNVVGLIGRWVRPDGGYVMEIKGVDAEGTVDLSYLNPRPINVGRAVVSNDAAQVSLTVVLRDVNYPGSTYRLTLKPDSDRLVGTYFHAGDKQTYEVFFERVRP